MLNSAIFLALFGFLFIIQALAQGLIAPFPGYGVDEMSWDVQATPGGPRMILNGTVEEVVAHLAQVNPHWKRDFGVYSKATKFSKRTYSNWRDAPNYDPPFAWQRACAYQDPTGIDTIDRTSPSKERPGASPGPRRCGRVSCSWSSAIWWCNDNRFLIALDAFSDIADGAWKILNSCTDQHGP